MITCGVANILQKIRTITITASGSATYSQTATCSGFWDMNTSGGSSYEIPEITFHRSRVPLWAIADPTKYPPPNPLPTDVWFMYGDPCANSVKRNLCSAVITLLGIAKNPTTGEPVVGTGSGSITDNTTTHLNTLGESFPPGTIEPESTSNTCTGTALFHDITVAITYGPNSDEDSPDFGKCQFFIEVILNVNGANQDGSFPAGNECIFTRTETDGSSSTVTTPGICCTFPQTSFFFPPINPADFEGAHTLEIEATSTLANGCTPDTVVTYHAECTISFS